MSERTGEGAGHTRLRLLGGWQLHVGGTDVQLNHREQRLTALLGVTGRSARMHVAGMLWPESTDARALASLRRAVLQTQKLCPGLLQADRTDVGLDPAVEVDVEEVRRVAGLTELPMPGRDAEALLIALAGEPLLPGWYDDWVIAEREHIEQLRVRALERIARSAFEMGDLVQAVGAARAAVDVDPLLESARELVIRAHLAQGDRGSALQEFHRYRDAMSDELGVAPSSSIEALVEPVIAADGATHAPRRVEPPAGHERRIVVPRPRTELAAPLAPIPPARPDPAPSMPPPRDPATTGARGAAARLLAAAALVLAASLALAGGGPDADDGGPDVRGAASSPTGDVPLPGLPGAVAGARPAEDSAPSREVVVRRVDAADGSAAFVVRATRRPARVRVAMRGPTGLSVVRGTVVRSQDGRRLVLGGLDPGTYRWLVTSPTAAPVTGKVTVADQPEPVASTPSPTPAAAALASVANTAPSPQPAPQPTPQPTPSPQPTQHATPSPQPSPKPTPKPTSQPTPTGSPSDPGTVAPTPVG